MYEPAGTIEGVVELVVGGGGWVVELVIRAGTGFTARVRSSIFYFLKITDFKNRNVKKDALDPFRRFITCFCFAIYVCKVHSIILNLHGFSLLDCC